MIETIIATILGDAAVVGCITGIVYFLGEKIFSLLYDAAKEKISIDIEKSKLEFENALEQKIKHLESQLERVSYATKAQYDIEMQAYNEISQKLCECTSSVENLYSMPLAENEVAQVQKAQEFQSCAEDAIQALISSYEKRAPFIKEEVHDALKVYTDHVKNFLMLCAQDIYAIGQRGCKNEWQVATNLLKEIKDQELAIKNQVRIRLTEFKNIKDNL